MALKYQTRSQIWNDINMVSAIIFSVDYSSSASVFSWIWNLSHHKYTPDEKLQFTHIFTSICMALDCGGWRTQRKPTQTCGEHVQAHPHSNPISGSEAVGRWCRHQRRLIRAKCWWATDPWSSFWSFSVSVISWTLNCFRISYLWNIIHFIIARVYLLERINLGFV